MPDHPDLYGVLPALITPFTPDGAAVDATALTAHVERLVGAGVGGLVPGGSTGEFTTLTHAERREVAETTIATADGRVPVVPGTGALSTRETIELSVHAEQAGAAAVMIVPPFYDPLGWRELRAHYTAVAERISIPIVYYNLPAATGVTLDAEQLRELQRVAGVTALKDTGGDAVAATELIQTGASGPDAAQRLRHADLRRAGRRRACRGVGGGVDPARAGAWRCTGCSPTSTTCSAPASSGPACGRCASSSRVTAIPPP